MEWKYKNETIYQRDLLVQTSDAMLTFAWFHNWEDKSVTVWKLLWKHYLKKQCIKEWILILIAPEQSKLWKYWAYCQDWRRCGQFILSIQSQGLGETGDN